MTTQVTSPNRTYELKKLKAECVAEENKQFYTSLEKRKHGEKAAEPGNTGLKATPCELFIYLIGQETETKSLDEQFKATRSYRKTKSFANATAFKEYLDKVKFPRYSILIGIYIQPNEATEEFLDAELATMAKLKQLDPMMNVMLLSNANTHAHHFDFMIFRNSETLGKLVTAITWAIREHDRIRKQIEAKQLIKAGIMVFVSAIVILFLIDFVTGIMSPVKQGVFGIIPILQ